MGHPTAVDVSSFRARVSDQGVTIAWETASEADIAGFNLRRRDREGQPLVQLNDSLIPAQSSGSPTGARYSFRDASLPRAGRYWYLLEVVRLDGTTRMVGPIQVRVKPGVIRRIDEVEQARLSIRGLLSRRFWFTHRPS